MQLLYSASAIEHITENLQGFAEFQAYKTHQQAAENTIAGGFMYKLLPNLQLDVLAGVGVSEQAPRLIIMPLLALPGAYRGRFAYYEAFGRAKI